MFVFTKFASYYVFGYILSWLNSKPLFDIARYSILASEKNTPLFAKPIARYLKSYFVLQILFGGMQCCMICMYIHWVGLFPVHPNFYQAPLMILFLLPQSWLWRMFSNIHKITQTIMRQFVSWKTITPRIGLVSSTLCHVILILGAYIGGTGNSGWQTLTLVRNTLLLIMLLPLFPSLGPFSKLYQFDLMNLPLPTLLISFSG